MKRRGFTVVVLLAVNLLIANHAFAADKTLKLALYTYPPISYQQDGDWGYCYELVKSIFEERGYEVQPRLFPVVRAIAETEALKTDAICAINPFNSKNLSLATYPDARLTYFFWAKKDSSFSYTGIDSLKGIKILNIKGFNYTLPGKEYQDYLEDKANAGAIRELSGDNPLGRAFQMIDKGRADTICLDEPSARFSLSQINMADNFKQAGSLPNVLYGYFGVSMKHPEKETLLSIYNAGHEKMVKSGKFAALLKTKGIDPWKLEEGRR